MPGPQGRGSPCDEGGWKRGQLPAPTAPLGDHFVWAAVWQQRRHLLTAFSALSVCVCCTLANPVLSGALFGTLVQGLPLSEYSRLLGAMVVLYAADALLSRVYVRAMCEAGERVQAALRREAFRVLLVQRIEFFDRHRSAELTALLSRELDAVHSLVFANVSGNRGMRAIAEATGSVVVLFWMCWRLAPLLAGVIMAAVAAAQLYRRQVRAVEGAHAAAQIAAAQAAYESFSNIRTVRAYAGEPTERERYNAHVASALASGLGLAGARALLECVNRGAVHASLLSLYAFGGFLVACGLVPVATLVAAMSFTWALVYSCQGVVQTLADCRTVLASLRRVQSVLQELPPDPCACGDEQDVLSPWAPGQGPPGSAARERGEHGAGACSACALGGQLGRGRADARPLADPSSDSGSSELGGWVAVPGRRCSSSSGSSGSEEAGAVEGAVALARRRDLEVLGVSFSYPTRPAVPVLRGLSLTLSRGKVTALVGRSGAGKTTLASLLQRLYRPSSGGIYLGGRDIQGFSHAEWVAALTAVSQDPVLFSGTVAENIAYGSVSQGCSLGEIERAARAANAHDFISALPEGYSTVVGERGCLLSGGQRQRVALARALLKDSPVLLLDEATSALDAESERLVQQAVGALVEGRTVLVIAHRLSTIQSADRIAVLERGRVEEVGTHAELLKRGGTYAQLVSCQSLALSKAL